MSLCHFEFVYIPTRFWKTSLRLIVAPMEPRGVFSPAPRLICHLFVMGDGDMWVVGVKTAVHELAIAPHESMKQNHVYSHSAVMQSYAYNDQRTKLHDEMLSNMGFGLIHSDEKNVVYKNSNVILIPGLFD